MKTKTYLEKLEEGILEINSSIRQIEDTILKLKLTEKENLEDPLVQNYEHLLDIIDNSMKQMREERAKL